MGAISHIQVEELRSALKQHDVVYLFIGKTGAILHGFPDTTQDAVVFAPDGIERFEDAWRRGASIAGFPVCSIDDIIASKKASNRAKDRETLPRLEAFRQYLRERQRAHSEPLPRLTSEKAATIAPESVDRPIAAAAKRTDSDTREIRTPRHG